MIKDIELDGNWGKGDFFDKFSIGYSIFTE